jgi:photosystem II stability/assembly factor-like uncharacterized protein
VSRSHKQSILATFAIIATISVPVTKTAPRDKAVAGSPSSAGGRISPVKHSYLGTPLRFERRTGSSSDFVGRGIGYAVSLSNGDAIVTLGRSGETPETITVRLAGRRGSVDASAEGELPGRSNQLIGNDLRRWKTGIPAYARIAYHDVYPGIDLVYYGTQQQLEYDFVLRTGASPADIAFDIAGGRSVKLDDTGNLVIETGTGSLIHRAPVLYQDVRGARTPIEGAYAIRPDGRVTFKVGRYDSRLPLVIDPVLSYATYLGGSAQERIHAVAIDASGSIVVAGETFSFDFPTANAVQAQPHGMGDAFVARLTPAGDALVYATYFGGSSNDGAAGLDVDASGAAYVTGSTWSWDFPTMNAFQAAPRGQSDTFVVKLDANGGLVYSTLLGGALEDYATAITVDGLGRAHLVGSTMSADFPTANALQSSAGGSAVFRTTNGGDTWSGAGNGLRTTAVRSFAIDPASPDTIYAGTQLEGVFKSTDGGTTWVASGLELGGEVSSLAIADAVPATVYAATQSGTYRSVDGGQSWAQVLPGWGTAVVVSPQSSSTIYAGLSTNSSPSGVLKSIDGGDTWTDTGLVDGVVALAVSGSTVYAATNNTVYSSVGGGSWTLANSGLTSQATALVANAGNPLVAYAATFDGVFKTVDGGVSWNALPLLAGLPIAGLAIGTSDPSTLIATVQFGGVVITNDAGENWRVTHSQNGVFYAAAIHPALATTAYLGGTVSRDAFVATLGAGGNTLEFSTYFGGSGIDRATDIAVDANGARYVVGETMSTDLPIVNAVQASFGDLQDAFALRIGPEGVTYATYLGGNGFELGTRVAVDLSGRAHIVGLTWSMNYPVVNAFQPEPGGGFSDLFVSVLDSSGAFVHSTYLGGSGGELDTSGSDLGPNVAATSAGDTYVTGTTQSLDFPVSANAFQPTHGGGQSDVFVSRLDAAGQLQYSTYLGGSGDDSGRSIALDVNGDVAVAGITTSTDFPTRNAFQPIPGGSDEGFIVRIGDQAGPADTVPPVTSVLLSGTAGLNGWYRSAVEVTLSATDGDSGSGVAAIRYRLNGGALQVYTGPFTIAAQGTTSVTAEAVDVAGNVEVPAPPTVIRIDTGAPNVAIASPQAREYLQSRTVNVSTTASDSLSGLAGPVSLTIDGAPFAGSVIDLSTLTLGAHVLAASASDVAGNTSQASVSFQVVDVLDTVINVPAEAATIQAAIDFAIDGDTVLVAPGTYHERLDFHGKAITVVSQAGPEQTIIDAGGIGSVVTFMSGETRAAVLNGFTIRGGVGASSGGGVRIGSSSPTIRGNVITGNRSCTGVGIVSNFGSPLIQGNRITQNTIVGCTGGWGIGIYIGGNSAAEIIDNEITDNTGEASSGGGIALFAAGSAVVRNNVIARNSTAGAAGCGWGGGIATANFSEAKIVDNLIVDNSACFGGGVYWLGSTGNSLFVNNTIADNEASVSWPGMYVSGFDARNQLHNNIITARTGPALYCQNGAGVSPPTLNSNDVFSAQGASYGGTCADQTGVNGNISADPAFMGPANRDYRVEMTSPVVDAGNNGAPSLPATDLAGLARVFDGNADGVARVDMGAFESRNRAPVVDAGADQTIAAGANCQGQVTLSAVASDPDGEPVTLTWSGAFGTASGPSVSLTLPLGTHVITVTADDGIGGRASDTVVVTVVDTTPPAISSVTATPSVIQKPNHEMIPVVISVAASDGCGGVDCHIASVTSNEPGDFDWYLMEALTLRVRAERAGKGNGRIYTITIECTDEAGNVATSTVTVTVPK